MLVTRSAPRPGHVSLECSKCRARLDGLCQGLSPDVLETMAAYRVNDRAVKAGEDLLRQGDPCDAIYNLVDGWIFLYSLHQDGRRQIQHFALPGAVLGYDPAPKAIATFGAQALTDATVCVIPHKALGTLSKQHPEIALRLAWLMSRDRSLAFAHLSSVGRHSARERVAHLLVELFVRYSAQWPGHRVTEMHLPLTQEHVGDATGLTMVHVNRVLRDLRNDGIVDFHYRRLRILDPDKLVDVAGIDPHLLLSWLKPLPPA